MSTSLTGLTTNFFPSAQNGFQTTLASTISSGAATVPLNSVAGYTNGQIGVFVVDPTDTTKKQTFTGVIDTAGVQVTSVVWTAGTNQSHTGGATVVDYATATHISMITKGVTKSLNQDGSLIGSAVRTALGQVAQTGAGWTTLGNQPNTITANGNRSYTCVFNAVDLTGTLSPGMRLMTTRTVAAPTQCTSLNGTTQYYTKATPAGMTFTDDFTASAWIKLTSYPSSAAPIVARIDATQGWWFGINSSGQVVLSGHSGALVNYRRIISYQSVPLNKWVHVAAVLDMADAVVNATSNFISIDGVGVPVSKPGAGTSPTSLVQAGNLTIGSYGAASDFFSGKIAQVAIYSAKVTQANIVATISQGLAGTETSLISAYSFNNSINDLNANANNLTANGSAVATNADSPFGGQAGGSISSTLDYGIITSASFSTNTTLVVQVPEGCTIPTSGGVSAVSYSTVRSPYGYPQKNAERLTTILCTSPNSTSGTGLTAISGMQIVFQAVAGKEYKVTAFARDVIASGGAGYCIFAVCLGSVSTANEIAATQPLLSAASVSLPTFVQVPFVATTTGSQTVACGFSMTANSAALEIFTTQPAYLIVEPVDNP